MSNEVIGNTFETLYPNFDTFKIQVLNDVNSALENTDFIDDTKTFYSQETIYNCLLRRYRDSFSYFNDKETHDRMINTLIEKLPSLHGATLRLGWISNLTYSNVVSNEISATSSATTDNVAKAIEDPDQTISPIKQENSTGTSDATNRRILTDIGSGYKSGKFDTSGLIMQFVNDRLFTAIFSKNQTNIANTFKGADGKVTEIIAGINTDQAISTFIKSYNDAGDPVLTITFGADVIGTDGRDGRDGINGVNGLNGKTPEISASYNPDQQNSTFIKTTNPDGTPLLTITFGSDIKGEKGEKGDSGTLTEQQLADIAKISSIESDSLTNKGKIFTIELEQTTQNNKISSVENSIDSKANINLDNVTDTDFLAKANIAGIGGSTWTRVWGQKQIGIYNNTTYHLPVEYDILDADKKYLVILSTDHGYGTFILDPTNKTNATSISFTRIGREGVATLRITTSNLSNTNNKIIMSQWEMYLKGAFCILYTYYIDYLEIN